MNMIRCFINTKRPAAAHARSEPLHTLGWPMPWYDKAIIELVVDNASSPINKFSIGRVTPTR
jgi:hypothetical protein